MGGSPMALRLIYRLIRVALTPAQHFHFLKLNHSA